MEGSLPVTGLHVDTFSSYFLIVSLWSRQSGTNPEFTVAVL